MTTTPTELLSTDCVECGLHFELTTQDIEKARKMRATFRSEPREVDLAEYALRGALRLNDWNIWRPNPDDPDYSRFEPTCPKCTQVLTGVKLATMPHPEWGCSDCGFDIEEGVAAHYRTWRVSGVPAVTLTALIYDAPTLEDNYDLSMVQRWDDFSADEALLLAGALMDVCKTLDEHGLRKVINEQVRARLEAHRNFRAGVTAGCRA